MFSPARARRDIANVGRRRQAARRRAGKVLVMMAVMLPMLFGITGLVVDGGLMMSEQRNLQHAVDAASTAAAMSLELGKGKTVAEATAIELIHQGHSFPTASITVNIPPASGKFAGQADHVEVIAEVAHQSRIMRAVDGVLARHV